MACTARSKSAPATATTKAVTKSSDVKPQAPLAPGIGEYVRRASEVAKLADTLQALIDINAEVLRKHKKNAKSKGNYSAVMFDVLDKTRKALFETWGALAGVYDVIISPPSGFEKVATSLVRIVSVVRGIDREFDIDGTYISILPPLRIACERLDAAIREVTWHLFRPIQAAALDDDYENDANHLDDILRRYSEHMAEIAAQCGIVVGRGETDWQHFLSELRENDPDSPALKRLTEESHEFCVENLCEFFERWKDTEREEAENDENYRLLVEALQAALPPLTPRPGETKEALADRETVHLRTAVFFAKRVTKVFDKNALCNILTSGDSVRKRLEAIKKLGLLPKDNTPHFTDVAEWLGENDTENVRKIMVAMGLRTPRTSPSKKKPPELSNEPKAKAKRAEAVACSFVKEDSLQKLRSESGDGILAKIEATTDHDEKTRLMTELEAKATSAMTRDRFAIETNAKSKRRKRE